MDGFVWAWYVVAGFLLGWIASTLTEWLWFRRRRLQSHWQQPDQEEATQESGLPFRNRRRQTAGVTADEPAENKLPLPGTEERREP